MKWDGKISLALATVAVLFSTVGAPSAKAQGQKPSVVFILADNVGYGDMGTYGGGELRGYPTPRADQLAREGLRLTQFLVEPSCTPSRSALMTGQYSIRNGLSLATIPGTPKYAFWKSVHDGPALQGRWLRDGNLRKVAPGRRPPKPAIRARFR
jgi:hypothetical protein